MARKPNRTYNLILRLLQENPIYRDDDRKLMWAVWKIEGYISPTNTLSYGSYLSTTCTSTETIRRTRQKIQEQHKDLQASNPVRRLRKRKEMTKGTFIFTAVTDPITNEVISYRKEQTYGNIS